LTHNIKALRQAGELGEDFSANKRHFRRKIHSSGRNLQSAFVRVKASHHARPRI
jgi:hypothetical protein